MHVSLFCDVRIGELLRELPTSKGGRPKNSTPIREEFTKADALRESGISKSEANRLECLAAHVDIVEAVISEADETAQTFAKVGIYADQRIGELLRQLPKAKGNQYQQSAEVGTPTKAQAIENANIDHHTAIDAEGESQETKKIIPAL